jgi:hypothetical protein
MVCDEAKSAPSSVRHEYLCLWSSKTCGHGFACSRARMLACEYACDGVRAHAARWLPWIMRGISTSEEEMEQDSPEIVKLAVVVVGGLTALC